MRGTAKQQVWKEAFQDGHLTLQFDCVPAKLDHSPIRFETLQISNAHGLHGTPEVSSWHSSEGGCATSGARTILA
jgi:hypothetical protein